MSWFRAKSKQHPEQITVPNLRFCGEQDGPPEREFKDRLAQFFERDQSVKTAYLAKVMYGNQSPVNVALCLETQFGPDHGLAEKIGKLFASMFGPREQLDIIFLSDEQQTELAKACLPFFGTKQP